MVMLRRRRRYHDVPIHSGVVSSSIRAIKLNSRLPSALRSLMYSRIGSRTGSLRSGVSSISVRRAWVPSMSRTTHFLSVLSWGTGQRRGTKERNVRTPCKGTKARYYPSALQRSQKRLVLTCSRVCRLSSGSLRSRCLPLGCEQSQGSKPRQRPYNYKPAAPSPHGSHTNGSKRKLT
ncbi:hypothetical protein ARMSODRAFT_805851 [Armillaria solidipes]|uniref:Uncharacterized protein n=1 Tax=Armillaria solidipes TaxID=1076256 RepID=A0A2H3AK26_9AGAR|nr:hypothetical protein ARMSODRAFT_805851 [Armillaria solidipes]